MIEKVYFASDFHLGIDGRLSSRERERQIVRWLDLAAQDATAIYLVGDLFDFWFEYRAAVPRGFVRLLGKLAELRDGGLPIHIFTGNHDMWLFDYLPTELGVAVYREPLVRQIGQHTFFIGHGDGLGPGDYGYKFIKRIFAHPAAQWLFARLHPNLGIGAAQYWSRRSRASNPGEDEFLGPTGEWLLQFAEAESARRPEIDFFVFGHRHLPIDYRLSNGHSRYINLGEWVKYNSYAVYEGGDMSVRFFETAPATVHGRS